MLVVRAHISAANNDPCANATLSATGVNIRQNIAAANLAVSSGYAVGGINPLGPSNPLGGFIGALYSYDQLVYTGGPQDVKNQLGPGTPTQRVDAGNISFGVTCPFGGAFCQFAVGVAQTFSGHPNPNGTLLAGFDTPSDNAGIRVGQAMRKAECPSASLISTQFHFHAAHNVSSAQLSVALSDIRLNITT